MSRYLTVLLAVLLVASVIGCEKSKLRDDMMGDSTWESSAGEEKWEAADQPPKRNDQWEEENAPMDDAPPAEEEVAEPAQPITLRVAGSRAAGRMELADHLYWRREEP